MHSGDSESWGVGIRAIVDGAWGFAATWHTDRDAVAQAARDAVAIAQGQRAHRRAQGRRWRRRRRRSASGARRSRSIRSPCRSASASRRCSPARAPRWRTRATKLKVQGALHLGEPGEDDRQLRRRLLRAALLARPADAQRHRHRRQERAVRVVAPPTASSRRSRSASRRCAAHASSTPPLHATEQAQKRLGATPVEPGKHDLVLAPSNLWLTIHESIGHPTELDRALGYEANFAGTSFATPDKLGKLKYRLAARQRSTPTRPRRGALAHAAAGTTTASRRRVGPRRERHASSATRPRASRPAWIGEKRVARHVLRRQLRGGAVPAHAERVARSRATKSATLDDIIAATDDGVLVDGRRLVVDRSPALQLPVRRPDVLGDQERQDDAHAARRRVPGEQRRVLDARAT